MCIRVRLHLAGISLHARRVLAPFDRWSLLLAGAGLATPLTQVIRLGWIANFVASLVPGGIASGDVIKSVYISHTHADHKTRSAVTLPRSAARPTRKQQNQPCARRWQASCAPDSAVPPA